MSRLWTRSTALLLTCAWFMPAAGMVGADADSNFQRVKLLVPVGDKAEEADVVLSLGSDRIRIRSKEGEAELKNFPYAQIKGATYSYSKHPRWKTGSGAKAVVGVLALPVFFLKGKKHWLTVQTSEDYAVLRLDKNNYQVILPAFETRSGVKVEIMGEEK